MDMSVAWSRTVAIYHFVPPQSSWNFLITESAVLNALDLIIWKYNASRPQTEGDQSEDLDQQFYFILQQK